MKIFSAAQIRACDELTINEEGIRSADLMERAAAACASWITGHFPRHTVFIVLCGTGNNGGDGLAITRMLHTQGYAVKAFLLHFGKELSPDCSLNLQALLKTGDGLVDELQEETFISELPEDIVIVDAILGTGINRDAEGWVARFIRHINQLPNEKIAIDIPSGMSPDNMQNKDAAIINAAHTLSFQFYKHMFLHPETGTHTGQVHILDIGLSKKYIENTHTAYYIIDEATVAVLHRPRHPFSHKGTYGTAMLVAGSYGMVGAAVLAAKAAMRAGCGKLTVLVPECGYPILQAVVPEAMCAVSGQQHIEAIVAHEGINAIGIGPGLGTDAVTVTALEAFLDEYKSPLVIDADALNILADHPQLMHKIPAHSILTPHPKEFERMFGKTGNSLRRIEYARAQAMKYNVYIILKGRHTAVLTPEGDCFYNLTGNAGLATAGSGDVLTGIIAGLLAQGYSSFAASVLGVYLHGLAGELASAQQSMEAMTAGDITEYLGKAFSRFYAAKNSEDTYS